MSSAPARAPEDPSTIFEKKASSSEAEAYKQAMIIRYGYCGAMDKIAEECLEATALAIEYAEKLTHAEAQQSAGYVRRKLLEKRDGG